MTGAGELRVKESDRISALVAGLRALGAESRSSRTAFTSTARRRLTGGAADAAGDHRLAMAFAIAGSARRGPATSPARRPSRSRIPGFFDVLNALVRED